MAAPETIYECTDNQKLYEPSFFFRFLCSSHVVNSESDVLKPASPFQFLTTWPTFYFLRHWLKHIRDITTQISRLKPWYKRPVLSQKGQKQWKNKMFWTVNCWLYMMHLGAAYNSLLHWFLMWAGFKLSVF